MRSPRLFESYGSRLTPARRPETVFERAADCERLGPSPLGKGLILPPSVAPARAAFSHRRYAGCERMIA